MFLALLTALLMLAEPRVSIEVLGRITNEGGTVRMRCRVPRHIDNRKLTMEVELVRYHDVDFSQDPENMPVFHEMWVQNIPCPDTQAVCTLWDNAGKSRRAATSIIVAGCQENDHESREPGQR